MYLQLQYNSLVNLTNIMSFNKDILIKPNDYQANYNLKKYKTGIKCQWVSSILIIE